MMAASGGGSQVEVMALTDDITDELVFLYFENHRRSGGGLIQSIARSGSRAVLTFYNDCDAERVLSRAEHQLQQVRVQVRRPPPWDPRKVALRGLDPDTPEEVLEMYLERVSGRGSFRMVRSADQLTLLVTFSEELTEEEFQRLEGEVGRKLLYGRPVCAQRVRLTGDLLVENISSAIPCDLLEMYFEGRRSGGGALQSVTMLRKNSAAIVSFCDWNVAQNVLRRPHSLQDCRLSVSPFYPDLLGPPDDDDRLGEGTPDPTENRGPYPTENRGPVPTENRGPVPTENRGPVPTENRGPVPTENRGPVPTENRGPVPTENRGPVPTEYRGPVPTEYRGPDPTENRGPVPTAHEQQESGRDPEYERDLEPDGAEETLVVLTGVQMEEILPSESEAQLMEYQQADRPPSMFDDKVQEDRQGPGRGFYEEEVVMGAAELRFMQVYHHELLLGMVDVTIFPLDEEDRFGFKVAGEVSSCRTAVEVLQQVWTSLSSRTITLDYPGVAHFLLQKEGQNALCHTETEHKCIIDISQLLSTSRDHTFTDPWRFVGDVISPELPPITDEPESPPPVADLDNIRVFASMLQSERKPERMAEEDDTDAEHLVEDLKDDEDPSGVELRQACELSLKASQEQQLDEDAQMLLAIQRSMDTRRLTPIEDEEMQRALEMSLLQPTSEDTEEIQRVLELSLLQPTSEDTAEFQRVLELSLREQQPGPCREQPAGGNGKAAQVRVVAADETGLVVACAALRDVVVTHLHTVNLEGMGSPAHLPHIVAALERKHHVRITTHGGQIQIQGFSSSPSQCQEELHQILNALQAKDNAPPTMMSLDLVQDMDMITVPEGSEEYNRVLQPFLKHLHDVKLAIDILQVQKIHNPLLYNQYQLKKQGMRAAMPGKTVERILYHGTSEGSAREICQNGFNRSFCGKNAVLYGQGVYFASVSELSTRDNYSPPSSDGRKFVLVARVLTGEFTVGKADMRTPPLIPDPFGKNTTRRYDSLVNCMERPTIYVIFHDTQAFPEYLITCSNRRDTRRGLRP